MEEVLHQGDDAHISMKSVPESLDDTGLNSDDTGAYCDSPLRIGSSGANIEPVCPVSKRSHTLWSQRDAGLDMNFVAEVPLHFTLVRSVPYW